MSEQLKPLFYVLWMMHPLFEVGIAALMFRRGLLRQFKFFFMYVIAQLITFAVLFPAYVWRSYYAAFYLYWCLNAVSVACGFLVIHEVFVDVFKSFHTLRDLGTVSTNSSEMPPWEQAILTSQRCVRIIQIGMVLFLLFFSHYVGVSRRQHSFGIALGFGSFATIELVLISSWIGNHLGGPISSVLNATAYNATLVLWLSYVAIKRPARDGTLSLLQPQRWEQSLTDIHHPLPADSLIPMFESMVDRALSRTQPLPDLSTSVPEPPADGVKARAAAAPGSFAEIIGAAGKS
jgi:hypothetical protein